MHPHRRLAKILFFATLLAWGVVMLGAYTRLGDAGLGCPDWPGCYGHLSVPQSRGALQDVAQHYGAHTVVEPAKAWKEMVHRYIAGTLGLIILGVVLLVFTHRRDYRRSQQWLAALLVAMLVFQAMLGMWTVTWQLLPLVVMGHLLGGMTLTALLWSLYLTTRQPHWLTSAPPRQVLKPIAIVGTAIIVMQIMLGGWTTANYASIVCPDFPTCHGQWWPAGMDWQAAFDLSSPIGRNYEGGVLQTMTRVAIHMAHRYGAVVVLCWNLPIALWLIASQRQAAQHTHHGMHTDRRLGSILLGILLLQMLLGTLNVVWSLPMAIAVMHNGVAVLLLLTWVTILYRSHQARCMNHQDR